MFADDTTIPLPAMYIDTADPSVTYPDGRVKAGRLWLDTSTGSIGTLKKRNAGNTAWDTLIDFDVLVSNDSVTNAKLANMAQATIKGRAAGAGTGDPQDLTATQATAILDNVVGDSGSGGTKGLVPAPGSGDAAAGKFLKADGTFAVPAGVGIGGSTGSTDNALLRADGTGGATAQSSAITVDDNGAVTVPEISAPSTPASGKVAVYAKSDKKLYIKDSTGTETDLTGGGGGTPAGSSGDYQYNNSGAFGGGSLKRETSAITSNNGGLTAQTFKNYRFDNGAGSSSYVEITSAGGPHLIRTNGSSTDQLRIGVGTSTYWEWGTGGVSFNADRQFDVGNTSNRLNQVFIYDLYPSNNVNFNNTSSGPRLNAPSGNTWLHLSQGGGSGAIRLGLGEIGSSGAAINCPASSGYLECVQANNASTKKPFLASQFAFGSTSLIDTFGSGSPEGAVTASVGSTYRRTDGGAGTSFYVKESGSGNTGWVAK